MSGGHLCSRCLVVEGYDGWCDVGYRSEELWTAYEKHLIIELGCRTDDVLTSYMSSRKHSG